MSTSPLLAPRTAAASSTSLIGTTVWLLRIWTRHGDDLEVYFSYDAALHAVATRVREDWSEHSWLCALPDTPDSLTDGQAVSLFYGSEMHLSPSTGELYDEGFDVVEHQVYGPEPEQLNLRMATLRVFDEIPDGPQPAPLTYRIDALGLTIAASAGTHGPVVRISNDSLPAGTALILAADTVEVSA